MTKKILLLVLFLPIIIMVCLFTTTDAVSLAIDIPVTGIDIVEENIVYLDDIFLRIDFQKSLRCKTFVTILCV